MCKALSDLKGGVGKPLYYFKESPARAVSNAFHRHKKGRDIYKDLKDKLEREKLEGTPLGREAASKQLEALEQCLEGWQELCLKIAASRGIKPKGLMVETKKPAASGANHPKPSSTQMSRMTKKLAEHCRGTKQAIADWKMARLLEEEEGRPAWWVRLLVRATIIGLVYVYVLGAPFSEYLWTRIESMYTPQPAVAPKTELEQELARTQKEIGRIQGLQSELTSKRQQCIWRLKSHLNNKGSETDDISIAWVKAIVGLEKKIVQTKNLLSLAQTERVKYEAVQIGYETDTLDTDSVDYKSDRLRIIREAKRSPETQKVPK